ncbi:MAG: tRNA nucleotidyltransferase/poly(A) polymerase family protein, partial [candidate division TM6 bacterium GW2011_GWF2_38_10]
MEWEGMDYKKKFIEVCQAIAPIINAIGQKGGKAYMVGGAVRDLVLRYEVKDIDIEVHSIALDDLVVTLSLFGHVREVGKQFGVIRVDGCDIDWSLPRKDSKGRKPEVIIDPSMTLKDACRRRDLTMNALAVDMHQVCALIDKGIDPVESMSIIDFYGGLADIAAKRLAAIDDQLFCDDPLRFFRVMQFIGRFEMQPTEALNALCARMSFVDQVRNVPIAKERIYEEIKKLLLKSRAPSLGFRWLLSIGRLKEIFPELYALIIIQQRPDYHPEGSAFEHTMQTLDAAACYEHYQAWNTLSAEDEKLMLLCAALMHDLGKAVTTDARLSCHGHERAG